MNCDNYFVVQNVNFCGSRKFGEKWKKRLELSFGCCKKKKERKDFRTIIIKCVMNSEKKKRKKKNKNPWKLR